MYSKFIIFNIFLAIECVLCVEMDPSGYILYCPCMVAWFLTKQFRVHPLTFFSGFGGAASLFFLAISAYFLTQYIRIIKTVNTTLFLFLLYTSLINVSLAPMPWLVIGEILPAESKGIGTGIAASINFLTIFIVVKTSPDMFEGLGASWTYVLYGTIVLYFILPETKGRFGNQADHFLGALGFAQGLKRTLVLPPWVEYRYGEPRSIQVPFKMYFKVDPLKKYHKVITMEEFMVTIAPIEWPPEKRVSFCYMSRGESGGCNAKEGNPFGPFWDTFNIDFVGSEFYGPLHYDTYHHDMAKQWNKKYPPEKFPILAFTGAPASFPVQQENRLLHKYLEWSDFISNRADSFINKTLPKGAFVGIHMRNGIDWVRACKHIPHSPNLFSAAQCLGYQNEKGKATMDMCMPTKETIIRQLKRVIKNYNNAPNNKEYPIRSVFVASDSNHMIGDLSEGLKRMKVSVFKYEQDDPHVDLAILGRANHFVGNCISSFTAFVKRDRDAKGFPSSFWAFPIEKSGLNSNSNSHEEL